MASTPSVLHLGKYYPPFSGGIEQVTHTICSGLSAQGWTLKALVHQHQIGRRSRELHQGVDVTRTPILGRCLFTPLAPFYLRDLNQQLSTPVDLLHLHLPNPSVLWCLFSPKARRLPWIVHWHADVIDDEAPLALRMAYQAYQPFERALLKRAAAVVTTSPHYAEHSPALKALDLPLHTIPLSADTAALPSRTTQGHAPLKVLTVGRLTYYKGHTYLLEALALLRQQGLIVELTLIGSGELDTALKTQAHNLGIATQVHFRGHVSQSELETAFQHCDLFCLASIERSEAFGVVLLEAMRSGKPCLVTDVPGSGMNWVVQDGSTGRVVARKDPLALAGAIKDACSAPERWQQWGLAGRARFDAQFTHTAVLKQWQDIYLQCWSSKALRRTR